MYKNTLLLPKTDFPMKPKPNDLETKIQTNWKDLYKQVRDQRQGFPIRAVHDGPPYANGEIHLGHAINKIIKDIIVRFLTMRGFDSPFVPGWDCHGLPIEHKVREELSGITDPSIIRQECHKTAEYYVNIQREQFKRLGILADWENPYLTLSPKYETNVLEVLETLVSKELVYRKLRPIAWCIHDETALADAELEYKDITSESIYIEFPNSSVSGEIDYSFLVWTTTPWSLPGNVALAVNPDLEYSLISFDTDQGYKNIICASERIETALLGTDSVDYHIYERFKGSELVGKTYSHPIIKGKQGIVVTADWVASDVGTGIVHLAPAHGLEDYQTAIKEGLEIICPIDEQGRFKDVHPILDDHVATSKTAIEWILTLLRDKLWRKEKITHSYPHCWRCHRPTITRATPQWFVDVEKIRKTSLECIKEIDWLPSSLENRMESMVENRPDWCISRQRVWGIPIPAISCKKCQTILLNDETIDFCKKKGSDWWLAIESNCPTGLFKCKDCNNEEFHLEKDILDVWFEAGSSFLLNPEKSKVICCEGSDQHRGWFQSSLLLSVAYQDKTPFDTVLTHGWIVDENGKKFSKSKGAPPVSKTLDSFGADIIRLFAVSQDYTDDYRINDQKLIDARDSYYKIRNTFRFILMNGLEDEGKTTDFLTFDPRKIPFTHLLDHWILARLSDLTTQITRAYEDFNFVQIYHLFNRFCVVELSSIYFDVIKDRLYADTKESESGFAARWVLGRIYTVLSRLIAPILPHTAEELWRYVSNRSIFLEPFPDSLPDFEDGVLSDSLWEGLFELREQINAKIEPLRSSGEIKLNDEVTVFIYKDNESFELISTNQIKETLRELCKVSEVVIVNRRHGNLGVMRTSHLRCDRCWRYLPDVKDGLCERCRPFQQPN